jgi:uncharacterized protein (TIGR02271 family)
MSSSRVAPEAKPDLVIPLVEESARVEKREVSTGKVRITTYADLIEETATATLGSEQVEFVRVPIDRVVTEAPAIRTEDGVTIIPVMEEVLFVEKQLVLREELHIRRRTTTETVEVPVTLKKQRATVERVDDGS